MGRAGSCALRDTPTPAGGASRPHTVPKSTWRKEEAPVPLLPQSRRGTDPALLWCPGTAQLLGWAWGRRPRSPLCPKAQWGCQAAVRGRDTPGHTGGSVAPTRPCGRTCRARVLHEGQILAARSSRPCLYRCGQAPSYPRVHPGSNPTSVLAAVKVGVCRRGWILRPPRHSQCCLLSRCGAGAAWDLCLVWL